jgi:hypothetical protein
VKPLGSGRSRAPSRPTPAPWPWCGSRSHSTYRSQSVTVHYAWHPLAGKRVPLFRRVRTDGIEFVHVEAPPRFSRELLAWMVDEATCAGMSAGAPLVAVSALAELRTVLSTTGLDPTPGTATRSPSEEGRSNAAKASSTTRSGELIPVGTERGRAGGSDGARGHRGTGRAVARGSSNASPESNRRRRR